MDIKSIFDKLFNQFNSEFTLTLASNEANLDSQVHSSDHWARVRLASHQLFSDPSEGHFLNYLYSESSKINSTFNLCQAIDFSKFKKIGDIGGAPFLQAAIISDMFNHLRFLLTDFDNMSCQSLRKLQRFSNFEINFFDAKLDEYKMFQDCDLLTMWAVDYALDDCDLLRLFKYIKETNKTLLLASMDIDSKKIGFYAHKFLKIVYQNLKKIIYINRRSCYVIHGILRNERYFKKLARIAGVQIKTIQVDSPFPAPKYRIYQIFNAN